MGTKMTTGLYCGVSKTPWRRVVPVCLRTVFGGTHLAVYVLLISCSGGTVSREGLWCKETSKSEEEPITRALALALTYVLVSLPEATRILAALSRYECTREMVAEQRSSLPPRGYLYLTTQRA